jgi:hypothetical protein
MEITGPRSRDMNRDGSARLIEIGSRPVAATESDLLETEFYISYDYFFSR